MKANNEMSCIFDLLRRGEVKEGINILYSKYYNKLYAIAFTYAKNENTSQDIVHNVIYKLLTLDLDKFPKINEMSWLYTVVKNASLDYLRGQSQTVNIEKVELISFVDKDINEFVNMDNYYSMIKGLNENQKEIVTLKIIGGYTHKEISKILNKPIGTVQWTYNTAIKKLKVTLSSLLTSIIISFVGLFTSVISYLGILEGESDADIYIYNKLSHSYSLVAIVAFFILLIVFTVLFVLIYKNSYKIPTKADKKSV